MSFHSTKKNSGTCNDPVMQWYDCSGEVQNKLQSFSQGCCSVNPCNSGRCIDKRDTSDTIPSPSDPIKPPNSLEPETSSPSPTSSIVVAESLQQSRSSNLQAPIIVLIITTSISLLIFLFVIYRGKKRQKDIEKSPSKNDFTIDQSSPGSSLLNHHIGYEEFHGQCFGSTQSCNISNKNETPIPDIEKTQVIEPPLEAHPAYKYLHDVDTTQPQSSIPTPTPVCRLPSNFSRSQATINNYVSSDEGQQIDLKSSKKFSAEGFSSRLTGGKLRKYTSSGENFEIEQTEDSGLNLEDIEKNTEKPKWVEVFPKVSPERSCRSEHRSIEYNLNVSRMEVDTCVIDTQDQVHMASSGRWSGSTLEPGSPSVSDWCISGDWGKQTQFEDIVSYLNGTAKKDYRSIDMSQINGTEIITRGNTQSKFDTSGAMMDNRSACSTETESMDNELYNFDIDFYGDLALEEMESGDENHEVGYSDRMEWS